MKIASDVQILLKKPFLAFFGVLSPLELNFIDPQIVVRIAVEFPIKMRCRKIASHIQILSKNPFCTFWRSVSPKIDFRRSAEKSNVNSRVAVADLHSLHCYKR